MIPNFELRPSPGASRHPLPVGEGLTRDLRPLPLGEGGRRPGEGRNLKFAIRNGFYDSRH